MNWSIDSRGTGEKIFIRGDLNGHVGKDSEGFWKSWLMLGVWSKEWIEICYYRLCNSIWFDIIEHLVQEDGFKLNYLQKWDASQIDFIFTQKIDSRYCKDCKMISGEIATTQQRLVVLDICIKTYKRSDIRKWNPKIR